MGSETDLATQGSGVGNKSLKTSDWKKSLGIAAAKKTPSLTGEFVGETHRVLKHTQTQESAAEGPNLLVGSGGSD